MANEPDAADSMKPRRRWFQFRLRTLLIGVVVLSIPCAYVASEEAIVLARNAWLKAHSQSINLTIGKIYEGNEQEGPGMVRRWLGDEPQDLVDVLNPQPGDLENARRLFPEACLGEFHTD